MERTGKIKSFNGRFGLVEPDDHSPDVYLHAAQIGSAAAASLTPGASVKFNVRPSILIGGLSFVTDLTTTDGMGQ